MRLLWLFDNGVAISDFSFVGFQTGVIPHPNILRGFRPDLQDRFVGFHAVGSLAMFELRRRFHALHGDVRGHPPVDDLIPDELRVAVRPPHSRPLAGVAPPCHIPAQLRPDGSLPVRPPAPYVRLHRDAVLISEVFHFRSRFATPFLLHVRRSFLLCIFRQFDNDNRMPRRGAFFSSRSLPWNVQMHYALRVFSQKQLLQLKSAGEFVKVSLSRPAEGGCNGERRIS